MHVNTDLLADGIIILGSAILVVAPFTKRRHRAPWAKKLFFAIGVIGILSYGFDLAANIHNFGFSDALGHKLYHDQTFISGILVGWLTSLVFSGQTRGQAVTNQSPEAV